MDSHMQNTLAEGYRLHRTGHLKQAAQRYKTVLKAAPRDPDALMLMGILRYELGAYEQAVKHLSAAIKVAPNNGGAHYNLGLALQARGQFPDALAAFTAALRLTPGDANAVYGAGVALVQLGQYDEAIARLTQAQPAMPDNPGVYGWLGTAYQAQGKLTAAKGAFSHALNLDPDNLEALCGLSSLPATSVRPLTAFAYSEKAAKLAPDNVLALLGYATWLEKSRRLDEAEALLLKCLKRAPRHPVAQMVLARIEVSKGQFEAARTRLEKLVAQDDVAVATLHDAYAILGKALDKLGVYENAFIAFEHKNQAMLNRPESRLLARDQVPHIIRITQAWLDKDGPASLPQQTAYDGSVPIFFIGFPRSGTTLMEMVLGSHPALQTSGELAAMGAVMDQLNGIVGRKLTYPDDLGTLNTQNLDDLRAVYWQCYDHELTAPPNERTLIDKNPLNFLYLPLIRVLFPQAKVLMALRDPRDVCISNFMQAFSPNLFMIHMSDMTATAHLYGQSMALWRTARHTIGLSCYEYRYEDLIDDFDATVGGVLAFLDLSWDEDVRNYQSTAESTIVSTPSYTDVSNKLNRKAIGQWKHYAPFMPTALKILQPDIQAFGYDKT
jgi:tetratricopeptide (TPR) repeat protein